MKIFYKTSATSIGGRNGQISLDDGSFTFDTVDFPDEPEKTGMNPEKCLAMGYAICFENALIYIAQQEKIENIKTKVSCHVGIGQTIDDGFQFDVDLNIEIQCLPLDEAKILIEKGHQLCPFSKAVRGNINVRLHVTSIYMDQESKFDL